MKMLVDGKWQVKHDNCKRVFDKEGRVVIVVAQTMFLLNVFIFWVRTANKRRCCFGRSVLHEFLTRPEEKTCTDPSRTNCVGSFFVMEGLLGFVFYLHCW